MKSLNWFLTKASCYCQRMNKWKWWNTTWKGHSGFVFAIQFVPIESHFESVIEKSWKEEKSMFFSQSRSCQCRSRNVAPRGIEAQDPSCIGNTVDHLVHHSSFCHIPTILCWQYGCPSCSLFIFVIIVDIIIATILYWQIFFYIKIIRVLVVVIVMIFR